MKNILLTLLVSLSAVQADSLYMTNGTSKVKLTENYGNLTITTFEKERMIGAQYIRGSVNEKVPLIDCFQSLYLSKGYSKSSQVDPKPNYITYYNLDDYLKEQERITKAMVAFLDERKKQAEDALIARAAVESAATNNEQLNNKVFVHDYYRANGIHVNSYFRNYPRR